MNSPSAVIVEPVVRLPDRWLGWACLVAVGGEEAAKVAAVCGRQRGRGSHGLELGQASGWIGSVRAAGGSEAMAARHEQQQARGNLCGGEGSGGDEVDD